MLEKQSLDEFLANVNKGKAVIVSLSPQSRASLAVHFGISPLQVKLKHCKIYFVFFYFPVTRPCMRKKLIYKAGNCLILCCTQV